MLLARSICMLLLLPLAQADAPPIFNISATSLYDAGLQQGRLASSRIKAWLASPEMTQILAFANGAGHEAFQAFKRDNSKEFPEFVEEMRGIAEGAGIGLDKVWCLNLISSLEGLMGENRPGHCSDLYAVSAGGYQHGFGHGHNEDWSIIVKDLWYFVKYTALPGANFSSCAGMVYPGTLMGWTPAWNSHGMYQTQNSVFPKKSKSSGLSDVFIQRNAICGESGRHGIDGVLKALARKGWSVGASVNVVDLRARRMANVETHEDQHAMQEVTESMGNYSHFNMYKELMPGILDEPELSTVHRQARVYALPALHSVEDIVARLSDTADADYPIFRNITIGTFVLDGNSGLFRTWHDRAAASGPETYRWNISAFFEEEDLSYTAPSTVVV